MALIKCRECGSEVSNEAKKCVRCGAPIKEKITFIKLILIVFLVLITLTIISNLFFDKRSSSTNSTSKSIMTLNYNLSIIELQDAQNKLNFTETASWFGGNVKSGKVFQQYVNLAVVTKSKDKNKLMQVGQFYRKRYEGCQWLSINFYPSIKSAPKTKDEESNLAENAFAVYLYPPGSVDFY